MRTHEIHVVSHASYYRVGVAERSVTDEYRAIYSVVTSAILGHCETASPQVSAGRNTVTNAVSNGTPSYPTRPDPSRPTKVDLSPIHLPTVTLWRASRADDGWAAHAARIGGGV
jgi:hypothetical protein